MGNSCDRIVVQGLAPFVFVVSNRAFIGPSLSNTPNSLYRDP